MPLPPRDAAAPRARQAAHRRGDRGAALADDDDLDSDEYVIETLLQRRMNCRTGRYEYLVRWKGFGAEEDTWEAAEGLPRDLRDACDAAQRSSQRAGRQRRFSKGG